MITSPARRPASSAGPPRHDLDHRAAWRRPGWSRRCRPLDRLAAGRRGTTSRTRLDGTRSRRRRCRRAPAVAICELTPITRPAVEQRAAGVARVDRRIGLDRLVDREAVGRLDRAADAGHDARRSRCGRARTGCRSRRRCRRPSTCSSRANGSGAGLPASASGRCSTTARSLERRCRGRGRDAVAGLAEADRGARCARRRRARWSRSCRRRSIRKPVPDAAAGAHRHDRGTAPSRRPCRRSRAA